MIADTRGVDTRMIPIIEANAAKIGITLKVRSINGAYTTIQTPLKNIPFSERPGWGRTTPTRTRSSGSCSTPAR